MSDNSDFVLRWAVNKKDIVHGMSSTEAHAGGFDWTLRLVTEFPPIDELGPIIGPTYDFVLVCGGTMKRGKRSCEIKMDYSLHDDTSLICTQQTTKTLDDERNGLRVVGLFKGRTLLGAKEARGFHCPYPIAYRDDTTLTVECRVKIINVYVKHRVTWISCPAMIDVSKFVSPNERANVTLVLGSEKLKVCREVLAQHSPVFAALFFKGFAEQDREEFDLKEVDYQEFVDLITLIFSIRARITDATVFHIIPLADRFEMKEVIEMVEDHLVDSSEASIAEKLLLADMYRLAAVKEYCLHKISNEDLKAIKETQEYAQLSASMMNEICDRLNAV